MSQVDKTEEARLAAELLGDELYDTDNNNTDWTCQCGNENSDGIECCTVCALPQVIT